MEYWDIYDINRNKMGRTMIRGEEFTDGDYHMVVHICIFNSNGEMLIQKRKSSTEKWPGMWDLTAGGSAIEGETSQDAVIRELSEELGIKLELLNVRPKLTINFTHGFNDVYIINKEVILSELTLQDKEVEDVKWASKDEIISMIKENKFIPYYASYITLLFDMRDQYGCVEMSK